MFSLEGGVDATFENLYKKLRTSVCMSARDAIVKKGIGGTKETMSVFQAQWVLVVPSPWWLRESEITEIT